MNKHRRKRQSLRIIAGWKFGIAFALPLAKHGIDTFGVGVIIA